MWQKVLNYYNTNSAFHSLVMALEYAFATYVGGVIDGWVTSGTLTLPTSKAAWTALGVGLAGALWSAAKRWAQTNVATQNLKMVRE